MAYPDDDQIVNGHLDEGTVHAWLDGQLSADEAARVESHVAACAPCAAQVAEARGFVAASSRILNSLDGVPARVVPARRHRVQPWHLRAAAAVVIVALGTAVVLRDAGVTGFSGDRAARAVAASDHAAAAPATVQQADKVAVPSAPPPTVAALSKKVAAREETPSQAEKAAPRVGPRDELDRDASVTSRANEKERAPTRGPASAASVAPPSPQNVAAAPGVAGGVAAKRAGPQEMRAGGYGRTLADSAGTAGLSQAVAADASQTAERDITGRVVDADRNTPVASAMVGVVGSPNRSAVTDDSGFFRLRVPTGEATLTARRIGFEPTRVDMAAIQRDTTIAIAESKVELNAVVVSGAAVSTCAGRVVSVSSSSSAGAGAPARRAVRLTSAPSTDSRYQGFALGAPSDIGVAPAGGWTPLGPDSAIVTVPFGGSRATAQLEGRSTDSVATGASRDGQIVRIRVRCAPR
jgi:hypothetical protein